MDQQLVKPTWKFIYQSLRLLSFPRPARKGKQTNNGWKEKVSFKCKRRHDHCLCQVGCQWKKENMRIEYQQEWQMDGQAEKGNWQRNQKNMDWLLEQKVHPTARTQHRREWIQRKTQADQSMACRTVQIHVTDWRWIKVDERLDQYWN